MNAVSAWKSFLPFAYRGRRTYQWRTNGQRCWELLLIGSVVATVEPDATYAGMWRIKVGDGPLSDMVNLSRAKDAAVRLADVYQEDCKLPPASPPMRQIEEPVHG